MANSKRDIIGFYDTPKEAKKAHERKYRLLLGKIENVPPSLEQNVKEYYKELGIFTAEEEEHKL